MPTTSVQNMALHYAREDVAREYASADYLIGPEHAILEQLRPRLADARMLDVGVGGGRTTPHFAPLVREYVGIDFSPAMIEACRQRFPHGPGGSISFQIADARALTGFPDESFDFVLFSLNGLDVVGEHEDRLRALREIHRVCRTGGVFCFCSSNFAWAESSYSMRGIGRQFVALLRSGFARKPRALRAQLASLFEKRRRNPSLRTLRGQGYAVLLGERFPWEYRRDFCTTPNESILAPQYYITPAAQIRQLQDVGFDAVHIYAREGEDVTDAAASGLKDDWRLYYVCSKA